VWFGKKSGLRGGVISKPEEDFQEEGSWTRKKGKKMNFQVSVEEGGQILWWGRRNLLKKRAEEGDRGRMRLRRRPTCGLPNLQKKKAGTL